MRALINGDLLVCEVPGDLSQRLGEYLVYRNIQDSAWYWHCTENKSEAVSLASGLCGHIVQLRTVDYE